MKPSGNLEYCFSGCLAFSQGQIPNHTGTVWSKTFVPVPWSFLTRPGTNSLMHRHSLLLRLLSQFLGAFSQGQVPTHTGKVPLLALTIYMCIQCLGDFFPLLPIPSLLGQANLKNQFLFCSFFVCVYLFFIPFH
jgi:hypothetical protein